MKKLFLSLIVLCASICYSFAEEVITTFNNSYNDGVNLENHICKARLYQVKLTDHFTYVTIELLATRNASRLLCWASNETYVESGDAKLPLLGLYLSDKNTYCSCTYNDKMGWNNVQAGKSYFYTLVFSGRLPEGYTLFSLKDPAKSGRGYGFSNYTINNPEVHATRDEEYCRYNADNNNDGICGIYDEIGGGRTRLACIKEDGYYFLVYLRSGEGYTWWFQGDLKARMEESATLGLFKAEWRNLNKTVDDQAYIAFDGSSMTVYTGDGNQTETKYLKMYPTASTGSSQYNGNNNYGGNNNHSGNNNYGGNNNSGSNNSNNGYNGNNTQTVAWSGTGFALTSNYVVTNYHVVEGARAIYLQGINGDFHNKYQATVIATDKVNDLAILRVEGAYINTSNIPYSVKTTTADVGEEVFVLGFPMTTTMGEELKLTTGVVSSRTGFQGDVSIYQISAPIQPGNSGGPLFDSDGNLIGIVSAKHTEAENVSYAIKASYLRNLMESAMENNILPQTNRIAGYKLSDKVKQIRNYVYFITCAQ